MVARRPDKMGAEVAVADMAAEEDVGTGAVVVAAAEVAGAAELAAWTDETGADVAGSPTAFADRVALAAGVHGLVEVWAAGEGAAHLPFSKGPSHAVVFAVRISPLFATRLYLIGLHHQHFLSGANNGTLPDWLGITIVKYAATVHAQQNAQICALEAKVSRLHISRH